MPRFCAVHLPSLRVEIAERCERERRSAAGEGVASAPPVVVVVAHPGGAVQRETDLLGNTRIDEVSVEARRFGVRRGQTIAAARAKRADLRVCVVAMDAVRDVLAGLCEVALGFGATVAFDEGADIVWADVTGCAHLFGGEAALAAHLARRVRTMGHACRIAVADGPRIAAALARHGRYEGTAIAPPGESAAAMQSLPIDALPLDGETRAWLVNVGARTVGDLQRLPRESLALRLGAHAPAVMALLGGDDGAPLAAYRAPEVIEERADMEYGVESVEALLFVVKALCDRTAARLQGRGLAAVTLELVLHLDRAMVEHGQSVDDVLAIAVPAPIAKAQELFAVLRAKVEPYAVRAPIVMATMRLPELARAGGRALDLFVAEAKAETAVPRLVAELVAELGDDRVGVLAVESSWRAEVRTRLVPFVARRAGARVTKSQRRRRASEPLVDATPEPSRLLGAPVATAAPRRTKVLARLEGVEWWRLGVRTRDVVAGWMEPGAVGCIEVDRTTGEAWLRGWMD